MRIVVVGIGAVGGLIAARLYQAGVDVLAVARGEHGRVTARDGLTVHDPLTTSVVRMPVADIGALPTLGTGDVALLAVKSHQTGAALDAIRRSWARPLPVVCAQNGVANEDMALRITPTVVAANVLLPATHLEPGHVHAHWAPVSGVLDVGVYGGSAGAEAAAAVADMLEAATFRSEVRPDIMRWKYAKLLMNLGNAVEAVCGPDSRGGWLSALLVDEAGACLRAAGIEPVPLAALAARTSGVATSSTFGPHVGGSTWQSVQRGATELESDYLNGEIVLLARRHGVAAPANELVAHLATRWARLAHRPEPLPEAVLLDAAARAQSSDPIDVAESLLPRS